MMAQLLKRQQAKQEGPDYTHAHTEEELLHMKTEAFKPIQDMKKRGKHRGKVKITIKQQGPDGKMVSVPLPDGQSLNAAFHIDKK